MVNTLPTSVRQMEEHFGSARDIEWAFSHNKLYLLQARPITASGNDDDEDLIHEFDAGLSIDNTCFTTANVGEAIPFAQSPLQITLGQHLLFGMAVCFVYWIDRYSES